MSIEELETTDTPDIMEILESHEIAIMEQGRKIVELETQIKVLERAVRQHVMDLEYAHKA